MHPGYGFLAEHAGFAQAVEDAGMVFIGPTPEQIRRFGAKDAARAAAGEAGLSLPAGSAALTTVRDAVEAAERVGFPLLVKSVAGGGGIGMLACHRPGDLAEAVDRTMQQSALAFGSSAVFLEKLIPRARHVEVQAFGDGRGSVVTLGERDCSTQRRRQKVVEEAPAPGLDDSVRAALADDARRLLAAAAYRSAGTVEFVLDVDTGERHFLEVNTRLQVEHAVTEAITGVDLVEWMVRAAAGDTSFLDEVRPAATGHAIEARLYAEDPAKGFQPSPGLVTEVTWPPDVRIDTWVRAGTEVTSFYDPLLAKLVVHGATRAEAVHALQTRCSQAPRSTGSRRMAGSSPRSSPPRRSSREMSTPRRSRRTTTGARPSTWWIPATRRCRTFPGASGTGTSAFPRVGRWTTARSASAIESWGTRKGLPASSARRSARRCASRAMPPSASPARRLDATLDGEPAAFWTAIDVRAGQTLALGARSGHGLRAYVLVRGGFDVGAYLGSASTFTLGGFGGHGGRELRTGDVLRLGDPANAGRPMGTVDAGLLPELAGTWELAVTDGPHGAPEFVTEAGISTFYDAEWTVHHHSSRTGVRLVGPTIEWARADGGEAGLHPSNVHDTPYTVGAVDFTGDMPIVLGPDGPSLGGFVCPVTVISADRWKVGQLAPGDRVRFVPVDLEEASTRSRAREHSLQAGRADTVHAAGGCSPTRRCWQPVPPRAGHLR